MLYVVLFMPVSGKVVVKRLKKKGWWVKGQEGSHVKLTNGEVITIVPIHGNQDLGIGLLKQIEKQTGEKLR